MDGNSVKIKFSKRGLEHELVQFTKDSLELIIGKLKLRESVGLPKHGIFALIESDLDKIF